MCPQHKAPPARPHPHAPPTPLPYRIRTLGRIRRQPYHSTPGTHHADGMFTLVLTGRGVYRTRFRQVEVRGGMAGLVLPGEDVGLLMAAPAEPYDHYYCRFAGRQAQATARRIVTERGGEAFFHWDHWPEAARWLEAMLAVWTPAEPDARPDRVREVDAMLARLLAMLDCPAAPTGRPRALTAESLENDLREHIADAADLSAVAERFGVSRGHLCRLGKQLLGDTIVRTWERMKMDWARALLAESGLPVTEVARRVGYADPFYFSKVFRRHAGVSPSRWRGPRQAPGGPWPAGTAAPR